MAQYIVRSMSWDNGASSMDDLLDLWVEADGTGDVRDYVWSPVDKETHTYFEQHSGALVVFEAFKIVDGKSYDEHDFDADDPEPGVEFIGYFEPLVNDGIRAGNKVRTELIKLAEQMGLAYSEEEVDDASFDVVFTMPDGRKLYHIVRHKDDFDSVRIAITSFLDGNMTGIDDDGDGVFVAGR